VHKKSDSLASEILLERQTLDFFDVLYIEPLTPNKIFDVEL
jgi:hypothetical protein